MIKSATTILMLVFSSICLADSFYCPNTASYVEYGADQNAVVQACGQPVSKTKKTIKVKEPVRVINYVYRFDQGSASDQTPNMPVRSPTIRPPVIVSFVNGQVTGIEVSGTSVQGTTACDKNNNKSINVGMTQAQIGELCGTMPDSYYGTDTEKVVGTKEVEVWTYQFYPQSPLVEFSFEDGKLASISQ